MPYTQEKYKKLWALSFVDTNKKKKKLLFFSSFNSLFFCAFYAFLLQSTLDA